MAPQSQAGLSFDAGVTIAEAFFGVVVAHNSGLQPQRAIGHFAETSPFEALAQLEEVRHLGCAFSLPKVVTARIY